MVLPDEDVFTSKPFHFIIQGKSFYVHTALIQQCSHPLDRMINGHMKEAQEGCARLDDVIEATFARFVRWLYNKDYTASPHTMPTPEAGESEGEAPNATPKRESEEHEWDNWGTGTAKKKKKRKEISVRMALKEKFINWDSVEEDIESEPVSYARSNQASDEDYTEVFLSHAQVYVFAEKYDIQPLRQLALRKLRHTLAIFTLFLSRVGDILTLLRYVYAETAATKKGENDIRTMLMFYVSTEMDLLDTHGGIKDMLVEDPEMLGDFLGTFRMKINTRD